MAEKKERSERSNQKLKLLYILKILTEYTDETHDITLAEIITKLKLYDINAERKSLYSDINLLRDYGYDIVGTQYDRTYHYQLVSRQFELAELKLLVDTVQSARFITARKSNELIKKIESLASKYEGSKLQRQVYVQGRVKTMNEGILYNVDSIHAAIGQNKKISFQYFNWNVDGEMELRHNGEKYAISPWALCWSEDNYYMVGFDSQAGIMKHYRVDKMLHIEILDEKREGHEEYTDFDIASYTGKMFGMFDAEEEKVEILCSNNYAGVMIDRFGKECRRKKVDDEHFIIRVNVAVSNQFLAWIMALGEDVKVIGPQSVLDRIDKELDRWNRQYGNR